MSEFARGGYIKPSRELPPEVLRAGCQIISRDEARILAAELLERINRERGES